jgi:hypothetical protein
MNAMRLISTPYEDPATGREHSESDGVLAEWVEEANRLAANHDGCHDMCSAAAIIRGYANLYVYGDAIPWDRVQDLLFRMRVCSRTGHFPKAHRGAA